MATMTKYIPSWERDNNRDEAYEPDVWDSLEVEETIIPDPDTISLDAILEDVADDEVTLDESEFDLE
jgi:hypothetical protein